jgi:hypothetical protein
MDCALMTPAWATQAPEDKSRLPADQAVAEYLLRQN